LTLLLKASTTTMAHSDSFVKTYIAPKGVTCLCGKAECSGFSAAFKVLRDSRKRFVKLPPYTEDESSNSQRACYLRHLLPNHPVERETPSNYIALHHFYPTQRHHKHIPLVVSLGEAVQLRMALNDKDKVMDENGMPAYHYCPNYPPEKVKQDLSKLAASQGEQTPPQEEDTPPPQEKAEAISNKPESNEALKVVLPLKMKDSKVQDDERSVDTTIQVPSLVTIRVDDGEHSNISSIPHEENEDDFALTPWNPVGHTIIDCDDLDGDDWKDSDFFNTYQEISQLNAASLPQEQFREIHKKSCQVQVLLKELLETLHGVEQDHRVQVLVQQVMDKVGDIDAVASSAIPF
jgi:hypothetical protein